MKQYHSIILTALEKFGEGVAAVDEDGVWYDAADLYHLAAKACETVYESMCSNAEHPWYGYAHVTGIRRAILGGQWYTVFSFETNTETGVLPALTLYVPERG